MKLQFISFCSVVTAGILLFSSCKRTSDIQQSVNDPARAANKSALHNALHSDISSKAPGDEWWDDEYADKTISNNSGNAVAAPSLFDIKLLTSFTYLDTALAVTGLDDVLADPSLEYTLFAPSDLAFKRAGFATIDDLLALGNDALTKILLYHVVSGKVFAADIPLAANTAVASLEEDTLFLTKKKGALPTRKASVNGTGIYIVDVDLGNGVMHDIPKLLLPPAGNIVEALSLQPDFTYLVAAVVRASEGSTDVAGVLSGPGPLTLFAPNNQAFINAGFPTIEDIMAADPDALAAILVYHVIDSRVFSCDTKPGDNPVMLNGETTAIDKFGSNGYLNNIYLTTKGVSNETASEVYWRNIVTTNGVMHYVDQVLLP